MTAAARHITCRLQPPLRRRRPQSYTSQPIGLGFHTLLPHPLTTSTNFPTTTCLRQQRTARQALCQQANPSWSIRSRCNFQTLVPRAEHLTPKLRVTGRIPPSHSFSTTKKAASSLSTSVGNGHVPEAYCKNDLIIIVYISHFVSNRMSRMPRTELSC